MPVLVVTRPQPDATAWVQQLHSAGVNACALPLLVIGPSHSTAALASVQAALQNLKQYDALMFVSANAVRYFVESLRKHALPLPAHAQYWSPGPGTSQALIAAGIPSPCVIQPAPDAAQFDSEALWQQALPHLSKIQNVLIVRGGDGSHSTGQGRQWLTEQLRARQIGVDFAPVYERQAPAITPRLLSEIEALRAQHAIWLFSSSECVQNLRLSAPAYTWHEHIALATHPRIAQQAQLAGFGLVRETQPSTQAIAASIKSLHDHL